MSGRPISSTSGSIRGAKRASIGENITSIAAEISCSMKPVSKCCGVCGEGSVPMQGQRIATQADPLRKTRPAHGNLCICRKFIQEKKDVIDGLGCTVITSARSAKMKLCRGARQSAGTPENDASMYVAELKCLDPGVYGSTFENQEYHSQINPRNDGQVKNWRMSPILNLGRDQGENKQRVTNVSWKPVIFRSEYILTMSGLDFETLGQSTTTVY